MNTGWTILTGRPPEARELTPKGAQVAAEKSESDSNQEESKIDVSHRFPDH